MGSVRASGCGLLGHDNRDGIIEYALPKDEHVEGRVDIQGVEDGQGGHGINGRYQRTKGKAIVCVCVCVSVCVCVCVKIPIVVANIHSYIVDNFYCCHSLHTVYVPYVHVCSTQGHPININTASR